MRLRQRRLRENEEDPFRAPPRRLECLTNSERCAPALHGAWVPVLPRHLVLTGIGRFDRYARRRLSCSTPSPTPARYRRRRRDICVLIGILFVVESYYTSAYPELPRPSAAPSTVLLISESRRPDLRP